MNEIKVFEGKEVEIIELNEKILFNAKNVAEILDIKNIRENLRNMSDKQVILLKNSNVKNSDFRKLANRGENFLTEAGVYKLAFRSNKASAERFTNWVAEEVLPSIRKHGAYLTPNTIEEVIANPDFGIRLLEELKSEQEKRKLLELDNERMKPKEEYYDKILNAKGTFNVGQISQDYGMSAQEFNSVLSALKIQYKNNGQWVLYKGYQGKGYTKSEDIYKNGVATKFTRWTPKGRIFLYEELKRHNIEPICEV